MLLLFWSGHKPLVHHMENQSGKWSHSSVFSNDNEQSSAVNQHSICVTLMSSRSTEKSGGPQEVHLIQCHICALLIPQKRPVSSAVWTSAGPADYACGATAPGFPSNISHIPFLQEAGGCCFQETMTAFP